jgi:hypothetical protein
VGGDCISKCSSGACESSEDGAAVLSEVVTTLGVPEGEGGRTFTFVPSSSGLVAAPGGAGKSRAESLMKSALAEAKGSWLAPCPGCSEGSRDVRLGNYSSCVSMQVNAIGCDQPVSAGEVAVNTLLESV